MRSMRLHERGTRSLGSSLRTMPALPLVAQGRRPERGRSRFSFSSLAIAEAVRQRRLLHVQSGSDPIVAIFEMRQLPIGVAAAAITHIRDRKPGRPLISAVS